MVPGPMAERCCAWKLIIGLDYGATFSGAWCVAVKHCAVHNANKPFVQAREVIRKTSTAIKCKNDGQDMSFLSADTTVTSKNHHTRRLFKMLLPPRETYDISGDFNTMIEYIQREAHQSFPDQDDGAAETTVSQMTAAYISGFYKLAIREARKQFPGARGHVNLVLSYPQFFRGVNQSSPSNIVFARFEAAVRAAGFPGDVQVSFVPEHEASLRAVLVSPQSSPEGALKPNEHIMVVDVGGMTIDSMVCMVPSQTAHDPGQFVQPQTTPPSYWGSMLGGAAWVDCKVNNQVKTDVDHMVRLQSDRAAASNAITKVWHEQCKPHLEPEGNTDAFFRTVKLKNHFIYELDESVITEAYGSVLNIIDTGMKELLKKCGGLIPKTIVFTGGFVQSDFAMAEIGKRLKDTTMKDANIVRPENSWNFVALGAATSVLNEAQFNALINALKTERRQAWC